MSLIKLSELDVIDKSKITSATSVVAVQPESGVNKVKRMAMADMENAVVENAKEKLNEMVDDVEAEIDTIQGQIGSVDVVALNTKFTKQVGAVDVVGLNTKFNNQVGTQNVSTINSNLTTLSNKYTENIGDTDVKALATSIGDTSKLTGTVVTNITNMNTTVSGLKDGIDLDTFYKASSSSVKTVSLASFRKSTQLGTFIRKEASYVNLTGLPEIMQDVEKTETVPDKTEIKIINSIIGAEGSTVSIQQTVTDGNGSMYSRVYYNDNGTYKWSSWVDVSPKSYTTSTSTSTGEYATLADVKDYLDKIQFASQADIESAIGTVNDRLDSLNVKTDEELEQFIGSYYNTTIVNSTTSITQIEVFKWSGNSTELTNTLTMNWSESSGNSGTYTMYFKTGKRLMSNDVFQLYKGIKSTTDSYWIIKDYDTAADYYSYYTDNDNFNLKDSITSDGTILEFGTKKPVFAILTEFNDNGVNTQEFYATCDWDFLDSNASAYASSWTNSSGQTLYYKWEKYTKNKVVNYRLRILGITYISVSSAVKNSGFEYMYNFNENASKTTVFEDDWVTLVSLSGASTYDDGNAETMLALYPAFNKSGYNYKCMFFYAGAQNASVIATF